MGLFAPKALHKSLGRMVDILGAPGRSPPGLPRASRTSHGRFVYLLERLWEAHVHGALTCASRSCRRHKRTIHGDGRCDPKMILRDPFVDIGGSHIGPLGHQRAQTSSSTLRHQGTSISDGREQRSTDDMLPYV